MTEMHLNPIGPTIGDLQSMIEEAMAGAARSETHTEVTGHNGDVIITYDAPSRYCRPYQ